MEMADLDPARVIAGDTVWDVEAARHCGLPCVAVLTGGISRHELTEAGAVAVYEDAEDLRRAVMELGAEVGTPVASPHVFRTCWP